MLLNDPISLARFGSGLSRPECIIAEADGTLWVADSRGGVMHISVEGEQRLVGSIGGLPNGIAMDRDGTLLVADVDGGRLCRLHLDGRSEIVLDSIEERPLGALNFVLVDALGRYWLTVSTLMVPRRPAAFEPAYDGHIILVDAGGARIVADGLCFPNEVRLDARGEHLYVSETAKRRIVRFDVGCGGALTNFTVHGPEDLGGRPDGIALDENGSLWVTDFDQRRLVVIEQSGAWAEIYRDPTGDTIANPTSITFAGPDLKTVYLGSLTLAWLPTFRSQVAGAPMAHWNAPTKELIA